MRELYVFVEPVWFCVETVHFLVEPVHFMRISLFCFPEKYTKNSTARRTVIFLHKLTCPASQQPCLELQHSVYQLNAGRSHIDSLPLHS